MLLLDSTVSVVFNNLLLDLLQWELASEQERYFGRIKYLGTGGKGHLDANSRSDVGSSFRANAPSLSDGLAVRRGELAVDSVGSLTSSVLERSVARLVGQNSQGLVGSVDNGTRSRAEDTVVSVVVADNVESQSRDGRFVSRSDSLVGLKDIKVGQSNGAGDGLAIGRSVDVGNSSDDVLRVEGRDNVDSSAGGDLVGLGQGGNSGLVVDDLGVGAGRNGAGPVVNDTVKSVVTGLREDDVLLPVGSGAWGARELLCVRVSWYFPI